MRLKPRVDAEGDRVVGLDEELVLGELILIVVEVIAGSREGSASRLMGIGSGDGESEVERRWG